jgi:hypothetical protein
MHLARALENRSLVSLFGGALIAAGIASGIAGCTSEELPRGGSGESCTRRADCAEGLLCLGGVCAAQGDAGADLPVGEGGACQARSDCQDGLVCSASVCEQAMSGMPSGNRYGGRGESCQAKNDCADPLACVGNVCRDVMLSLSHTGKDCHRVECEASEDCCTDFVPNPNCDAYRENCEVDPIFCNTYRALCECNKTCEDELCVASAPGCTMDAECTSAQTPFCADGTCKQCREDSQCAGAATQCVDGVCMAACALDEHCPLLHACQDSACVMVGCSTDRECVFAYKSAQAICVEGDCRAPCDGDDDCVSEDSQFQVCEEGQCVFVGCENDAECRAFLDLYQQSGPTRAVCR